MSRSELHDWECAIEKLCGDNADKMLAIAQDIYNTAFVRGKNYMTLMETRNEVLDKIRAKIEEIYQEIDTVSHNEYENAVEQGKEIAYENVLEMIDKYKAESEG